ncbi:MAG: methyltransferase [Firmicutes bacterium]|nr:methyltransferase [Bacillota bacterium]
MKNKVNVDVMVPALEEQYNVFIPVNKRTIEIIFLLNKAINELSSGSFPISEELSLVDGFTGSIYDTNKTIKENKILNGSKIILM